MILSGLKKELRSYADKEKAKVLQGFFKTGKGQYGEGDVFAGITVPEQRKIAKKYIDIKLSEIEKLLNSKIHEHRLTGFIILTYKYEVADEKNKKVIFNFYIKNRKYANNWDIVDVTAPNVIGEYLLNKEKDILYKFAKSKNLWERRIAIISTLRFIKNDSFKDTLKISEILLKDKHDLINKAVGWMLREVGKKDQKVEEDFIKKYYKNMSRTTLRYAIERFPEKKRQMYLKLR
jgi:3-methyladenine DNA glycosylase AlkD